MSPPTRLKVLLTEGSSTSARETLYALGGNHTIDILDPSPWCQCRFSRFVRRVYRCPVYSRDPIGYLEFLARRLTEEKYDVLFPTHEQVYLLSRVRERLLKLTHMAVPRFAALKQVFDKASFCRLLLELELPHPRTEFVRSRADLETASAPVYIKLAHGTAGQSVWRIDSREQLERLAEELERKEVFDQGQDILLQQPIDGEVEGVGGLFQEGRLVAIHGARTRVSGVGGAAMARISFLRDGLVDDLRRIGEHLSWDGPLGFDYIFEPGSGRYYFLEACPRIGETVNQWISGDNWCEKMVQMSLGERLDGPPEFVADVKTHQMFLNVVAKALEGKSRLTLLSEVWRWLRSEGTYHDSQDELTRIRDDWLSVLPAAAVTSLMLAYPKAARRLVSSTVDNYSLTGGAAKVLDGLTDEQLENVFAEPLGASRG